MKLHRGRKSGEPIDKGIYKLKYDYQIGGSQYESFRLLETV